MTTDKPDKPLNAREMQAARMIAGGWTHQQVAQALGVVVRTIERWNARRSFRDAVNALTGTVPVVKSKNVDSQPSPSTPPTPIKLLPGEPLSHPSELISDALQTLRDCLQGDYRMADKLKAVQMIFDVSGIKPLIPHSPKPESIANQEDILILLSQLMQDPNLPEHTRLSAAQSLGKIHGLYGEFNESVATLRKYGISIWNDGEKWHISKIEI